MKRDMDRKNLSAIGNHLDKEVLLYKKYLSYGNMCYDSELKNICYKASQRHKENYENMLSYLKN